MRSSALSPKKILLATVAAAAAAVLAAPATAGAIAVQPKAGGSPNADAILGLYQTVAVFGIIIFLLVEGVLLYSLKNFRASTGAVASKVRDNDRLEYFWTGAAIGVVLILIAVTFINMDDILDPPNGSAEAIAAQSSRTASIVDMPNPADGKRLVINVTGRQFLWRYTYGDTVASPFSYTEMVAPSETVVVLRLQATDVIHSWWIPALGGKFDTVPGSTNYTWFKAPAPKNPKGDVYTGQCAEFCGSQHAAMVATVRIVTPAQFKVWLAEQKQRIAAANRSDVLQRGKLAAQGQIPDLTPPAN